ncbi:hypothetical protein CSOJ01_09908 [Colletotrichum sojae]|uniref:Uncharacterized protein n=1 Tax=Colletotrichum sojae TaxID=2175907 RepID=A0A8H6MQ27_9PEZI|nr:hypothetical protein CSOJ01_09908 [Colletotrichum sojae]
MEALKQYLPKVFEDAIRAFIKALKQCQPALLHISLAPGPRPYWHQNTTHRELLLPGMPQPNATAEGKKVNRIYAKDRSLGLQWY